MAKPATISDLFTPLHSIESCMQKDADSRKADVEKINNSILSCAGAINEAGLLIAEMAEEASDKIVDSLSGLDNVFRSIDSGGGRASRLSTAKIESISTGVNSLVAIAQNIQIALEKLQFQPPATPSTAQTEVKDTKSKKDAKFAELKDLAKAAKEFKDISLKDALLMKPKIRAIVKAAEEVQKLSGNIDPKEVKNAADALQAIAKGILEFNASMALSAILAPVALVGVVLTIPVIWAASKLFGMMGDKKFNKDMVDGAKTLGMLGLSLVTFSLSLLASTMIIKYLLMGKGDTVDPSNLIGLAGSLVVIGLMFGVGSLFALLGSKMMSTDVRQGATTILLMNTSIITFSLALLLSYKITEYLTKDIKENGTDNALMTVGVFALMLSTMALFSLVSKIGGDIKKGAIGVMFMSGAIVLFSLGLLVYVKATSGVTLGEMMTLPLMLGVLGVEFGLAGAASEFILPGAAAVAAMSGALVVFGLAMAAFMPNFDNTRMTGEQLLSLFKTIGVLGAEFAAVGLLTLPIMAGSGAVAAMGGAMYSLGSALEKDVIKSIKPTDVDGFIQTLLKLNTAFSTVGGANVKTGDGPLKKLFQGVTASLTPSDVNRGIRSARKMGKALMDIGHGILEFQSSIGDKVNDKKFMEELSNSIATVITTIGGAFNTIGQLDANKQPPKKLTKIGALFDNLVTTTFGKKTDIERGINSVKNLGETLVNIAEGLKVFKDIVPNEKSAGWVGQVGSNIALMLDALVAPLTKFGTKDTSYDISATATGVAEVNKGFSALRAAVSGTLNFSKHEVDITAAMEQAGHLGEMVKGIAEGIKELGGKKIDLGEPGVIGDDFTLTGGKPGTILYNIQSVLCGLLPIFTQLGEKIRTTGVYKDVKNEGLFKKTTTTNSYLGLAVTSISGVIDIVKNTVSLFKDISELYKKPEKINSGIDNAILSINSLFTQFKENQPNWVVSKTVMDQYVNNVNSLSSSMTTLTKISEAGSKLNKKAGASINEFSNALASGINTLSKTGDLSKATAFIDSLTNAVNKNVFNNIKDNTAGIAAAINSINNDIMTPYAEMIAAIGTLSEHADKHKDVLNNLKKTIEEILEKINEYSGGNNSTSTSNEKVIETKEPGVKKIEPKKPTPLPPSKIDVNIDSDFINALNKLTRAINEKPIFNI